MRCRKSYNKWESCQGISDVKEGDVIEIEFGNRSVKVRVLDVKDTVKKEEAADMFEYI